MTDLQRRMHETVCAPAGLTACLCGSYARVGEAWAREVKLECATFIQEFWRPQTPLTDIVKALDSWLAIRLPHAALSAGAGEK